MKTRISMKWLLLGLLIAFSFAVAPLAGAQPGTFVKGVLQPLADGFPKRPLNIIVADDPGTRDDIYAKSLQAALRGISPVNILVTCEQAPLGGTWFIIKDMAKRDGGYDGYYPIVISNFGTVTDLITEPTSAALGLKYTDLAMVTNTEHISDVLIVRKNAPWGKTFDEFVKYGKANPGKLRYISSNVGSGPDLRSSVLIKTMGLKVEKIPQGGNQAVASTIGAGEGDFSVSTSDIALPNWQAGRVDVIMAMGSFVPAPWDKDPKVVTGDSVGLSGAVLGPGLGIGVPRQVPKAHIDWLFKLFSAGASSDLHKKREQMIPGLKVNILGPAEADALNKKLFESAEPVIRDLGLHVDQKKK